MYYVSLFGLTVVEMCYSRHELKFHQILNKQEFKKRNVIIIKINCSNHYGSLCERAVHIEIITY